MIVQQICIGSLPQKRQKMSKNWTGACLPRQQTGRHSEKQTNKKHTETSQIRGYVCRNRVFKKTSGQELNASGAQAL